MSIPHLSKKIGYLGLQSFVFDLEKLPKNLTFQSFLAPTARKYVAEQGIVIMIKNTPKVLAALLRFGFTKTILKSKFSELLYL